MIILLKKLIIYKLIPSKYHICKDLICKQAMSAF